MFSGIIQALGTVETISYHATAMSLSVRLNALSTKSVSLGDSIAVNGVCLTVTAFEDDIAYFDISSETLAKTLLAKIQTGDSINLETALTLETPLGGHLVSGHVDGLASVASFNIEDNFAEIFFVTDKIIGQFLAEKGSVGIDGISLTTNKVEDREDQTSFSVMLVPHTLANTTLGYIVNNGPESIGHQVHIEVDQVARYVKRLLHAQN